MIAASEIRAKAARNKNVREPDGIVKLACVASAHERVDDRVALA